jgi:hypothetical protein
MEQNHFPCEPFLLSLKTDASISLFVSICKSKPNLPQINQSINLNNHTSQRRNSDRFPRVPVMASEDVKTSESAVSTIVNFAEEAKLAREGVKAPGPALLSICKSLVAGGVAGGV